MMNSTDVEKIQQVPIVVVDLSRIDIDQTPQNILSLNYDPILQPDKFIILTAEKYNTLMLLSAINKIIKSDVQYLALGIHIGNTIYIMHSRVDFIAEGDLLLLEINQSVEEDNEDNQGEQEQVQVN